MLLDRFDMTLATPDSDHSLLADRTENEAYLTCIPGRKYAVYFPAQGAVTLTAKDLPSSVMVEWLDIAQSKWRPATRPAMSGGLPLATPGPGHWLALIACEAPKP